MERFMMTVADAMDRRSLLRRLGKLGMAAAAAGALLLPKKALAGVCTACSDPGHGGNGPGKQNPCRTHTIGQDCQKTGQPEKTCQLLGLTSDPCECTCQ